MSLPSRAVVNLTKYCIRLNFLLLDKDNDGIINRKAVDDFFKLHDDEKTIPRVEEHLNKVKE